MIGKFLKTNDVGYLLGEISDNVDHKHYAIQMIVSLGGKFVIQSQSKKYHSKSLLVKSQVTHQLNCLGQQVLIILINPASKLGHLLNKHHGSKKVQEMNDELIKSIKQTALNWNQGRISNLEFIDAMDKIAEQYSKNYADCFKQIDKRIVSALNLLRGNTASILPLETIAAQVYLSPSRFIHLFKNETGITYRRMQLWNKLMSSIDDISSYHNITDLAHAHGFSDSAHYSRTFKQTFGLSPKSLIKYSQFIQF